MSPPRQTATWPACRWTASTADPATVARLTETLGLSRILATCLAMRGLSTPEDAGAFLDPRLQDITPPDQLPGVSQAADIILSHVRQNSRIIIFGDYDADGITAAATLLRVITAMAGTAIIFIPDRMTEGYGFTPAALRRCLSTLAPVNLIVTVDCGITQSHACREAVDNGVDVIITDHHSLTETIPETARAVINPELPGTPESLRQLCGAGVAFKLAHQLARLALSPGEGQRLLKSLLPAVAIGTVADLVPLTGENRLIVSKGLEIMNRPDCGGNPGIRALKFKAGVSRALTATDLGFSLAPRINAAGRIGHPETAVMLLNTACGATAMKAAEELEANNRTRREEETAALEQARTLVERAPAPQADAIVLYHEDWHPGIIGLVAARLVSTFGRPAIILTGGEDGVIRGSARCPEHEALDLMPLLEACSPALQRYGGHRVAAGLSLRAEQMEDFRLRFETACRNAIQGIDLRRTLVVDDWITPAELDETLEADLRRLEPCGMLNPLPRLGTRGLTLRGDPRAFGKEGNHWALTFAETPHRCVAFRRDTLPFKSGDRIDVVYTIGSSMYDSVQMLLKDAAFAAPPTKTAPTT